MAVLNSAIIHGFTSSLLLSKFDDPKPTPQFHHELWELVSSSHPRVAIAAPRGHAKSTAITHCFVLACVMFRVKDYVLIVSDTVGQSILFLNDIKRELLENEPLRELFGFQAFIKDTEDDVIGTFDDGKQFRIVAKGSEQKVRGLKWRNKRPNLIVCDDLENDEIVLNEERRHKFRQWFFNALIPCGSNDCSIRVVGTILHLDSLLERLMPSFTSKDLRTDGLRYWVEKENPGWLSVRYRAHNEDYSRILWPEKFSQERLLEIRQLYVEQGFPEGYAQEYLNKPIDESNAYFRKEDLIPIQEYDEYLEYYVGADLAISEKDTRAYTAIVVAGLTRDGRLKVVDVRRFRGDSLDIVNEIFAVQERYEPELFAIEEENIAKSIGPFLYEQMGNGKPFINLRPMPTGNKDKIRRARSIQARTRAGKVEFDHQASWWPAFQEELLYFPRGSYMDQVDAFAWIGILLDKMVDAKTQEELIKEAEEQEYESSYDEFDMGMNPTTGY